MAVKLILGLPTTARCERGKQPDYGYMNYFCVECVRRRSYWAHEWTSTARHNSTQEGHRGAHKE